MTQPDWDDDRLDAAFHGRFDRAAPVPLAHEIHVRIAGTTPAQFGAVRVRPAWSVAVAAVVVVAVATTALIGLGGLGRSGGPPPASDAATSTPGPNATPTEQALAGSLFDGALPIVGVSDAIAIRDAGADDREIAIHGWFRPAWPISCPFTPTTSPLQMQCPDRMTWLTRDFEVGTVGQPFDPPAGPGFNPDLDGIDTSWEPSDSSPIDVVFVGHFDDRRASLCPPDEIAACRDRFVVDEVARIHGEEAPTNTMHIAGGAVSTDAEIEAIVANEAPGSPILSVTVVNLDGLARLEPSLDTGHLGAIGHPNLWIVRVLESERIATYVVIDGSDAIFEMNPENEPILVGGTPPTPHASASSPAWPPADALVLDLPGVDIDKPPVRVAIVDESNRFVSAIEQDPVTFAPEGRFGATGEPGKPGRVNLSWVGGLCDSQVTITIAAGLRSILFDMGPQPDCDSMGVEHELVMNFTGTVDVPSIQVGEATTTVGSSDAPVSSAYTLDCLTFAPDDCQQRADRIVAATPSQRVVAFAIVDRCGSYRVTFSDGTSTNTIVDCTLGPGTAPSPQASGVS